MMCLRFILPLFLFLTCSVQAATPMPSMVILGDSLSDTGNVYVLLKSLRNESDPAYLVEPLRAYLDQRLDNFAKEHHNVPGVQTGVNDLKHFMNEHLAGAVGEVIATVISKTSNVPVIPPPPYWNAHFSNGLVWNEYLADMQELDRNDEKQFLNRAFGGSWSVTMDHEFSLWEILWHPSKIQKQILDLVNGKLIPPSFGLINSAYLTEHPNLNPKTVYFIFYGGNDYLNALNFEKNYEKANLAHYVENVVSSIKNGTDNLIKQGAKQIVIIGMPKVGNTPRFKFTDKSSLLNMATKWHNAGLQKMVLDLQAQHSDIKINFIDLASIFDEMLDNPKQYGFTDVNHACTDATLGPEAAAVTMPGEEEPMFANNYVLQQALAFHRAGPQMLGAAPSYTVCNQPNEYAFWDQVHPTTASHKLIAQKICESMVKQGYQLNCQPQ